MKLTIFGATGGTGRLLVGQALDAGHHVTAVVREPSRLTIDHPALDTVVEDVFDSSSLESAFEGRDAALSALGPHGRKDTSGICSAAIGAILEAMEATRVRRVVALSAQPVFLDRVGEPVWSRLTVRPLVRAIYRNVYVDLAKMETRLTRSGSDWTILRPPYLTDKPGTGSYRAAVDANVPGSIARADLALAMLDVLEDPSTIRHAVGVAGPRE